MRHSLSLNRREEALTLLLQIRAAIAMDPRDKIYCMLGLASATKFLNNKRRTTTMTLRTYIERLMFNVRAEKLYRCYYMLSLVYNFAKARRRSRLSNRECELDQSSKSSAMGMLQCAIRFIPNNPWMTLAPTPWVPSPQSLSLLLLLLLPSSSLPSSSLS